MSEGPFALVVEDHGFQRRMLIRMLRSIGIAEVHEASDGRQALEVIRNEPHIDIVVCDLDMPGMDGMEFLRHMGKADSHASVIICSAQENALLNSVEEMARAYGVRLLGVLEKPVDMKQLDAIIDRYRSPSKEDFSSSTARNFEFTLEHVIEGLRQRQFKAWFQPKVDVASGSLVGAEALVRWHHPEHGVVMPSAFVALLDENRPAIDELTLLMLEEAANACRCWRERGLDMAVAVNLSISSLVDISFAERVTWLVAGVGLHPEHMVLEITETAAMTDVAPVLENLVRLRMRGFGLAIDDYGTGYSSMQQLARIPFTELKIDRGFVSEFLNNRARSAIVKSSVEMARRLGISSVAEGVETAAELNALKAMGCDIAQGYFFSKPIDADAFMTFSENWRGY